MNSIVITLTKEELRLLLDNQPSALVLERDRFKGKGEPEQICIFLAEGEDENGFVDP